MLGAQRGGSVHSTERRSQRRRRWLPPPQVVRHRALGRSLHARQRPSRACNALLTWHVLEAPAVKTAPACLQSPAGRTPKSKQAWSFLPWVVEHGGVLLLACAATPQCAAPSEKRKRGMQPQARRGWAFLWRHAPERRALGMQGQDEGIGCLPWSCRTACICPPPGAQSSQSVSATATHAQAEGEAGRQGAGRASPVPLLLACPLSRVLTSVPPTTTSLAHGSSPQACTHALATSEPISQRRSADSAAARSPHTQEWPLWTARTACMEVGGAVGEVQVPHGRCPAAGSSHKERRPGPGDGRARV